MRFGSDVIFCQYGIPFPLGHSLNQIIGITTEYRGKMGLMSRIASRRHDNPHPGCGRLPCQDPDRSQSRFPGRFRLFTRHSCGYRFEYCRQSRVLLREPRHRRGQASFEHGSIHARSRFGIKHGLVTLFRVLQNRKRRLGSPDYRTGNIPAAGRILELPLYIDRHMHAFERIENRTVGFDVEYRIMYGTHK